MRQVTLHAPELPFLSNVSGQWIRADEATDPSYWVRQMRQTVRFSEGLALLLEEPAWVLLEVGPGQALSTLARRHPLKRPQQRVLCSLPNSSGEDDEMETFLQSMHHQMTEAPATDVDRAALETLKTLGMAPVEVTLRIVRSLQR